MDSRPKCKSQVYKTLKSNLRKKIFMNLYIPELPKNTSNKINKWINQTS